MRLRVLGCVSSIITQYNTCTIIAIITDSGRRIDGLETMRMSSTVGRGSMICVR
jgi:hypothetical protein